MKTLALLCISLVAVIACKDGTAPWEPGTAVPDAVPAADTGWLRAAWQDMLGCSKLSPRLKYTQIRFYSVSRYSWSVGDTITADGQFFPGRREIYLARFNEEAPFHNVRLARHEIMHAMLWPTESGDHPPGWFGDAAPCGNLMALGWGYPL